MAKMAPKGKLFDKIRLPEIARESGCHYVAMLTVSRPFLVEKVIRSAVYVAREIGPTYVQFYTPCLLELGKQSMEGLQEMRDAEASGSRFEFKEYVSDEAKAYLARLEAEQKDVDGAHEAPAEKED